MCKGFSTLEFPHNLYSQKNWFWVFFRAKLKIWCLILTKLTNRRNDNAKLSVGIWVDQMMIFPRICFSTSNCKPAVILRQMKSLKKGQLCFVFLTITLWTPNQINSWNFFSPSFWNVVIYPSKTLSFDFHEKLVKISSYNSFEKFRNFSKISEYQTTHEFSL